MRRKNGMFFNQKTVVDGITFDSKTEAFRYQHLKRLQEQGVIDNLKMQVEYELIPKQYNSAGKLLFRECKYISDFEYDNKKTGEHIVEDVKSDYTERMTDFNIKRKLMFEKFGIYVMIVKHW